MKKRNRRKSGFTLLEIIIVVAILGMLAAIVIPNYASSLYLAAIRNTEQRTLTFKVELGTNSIGDIARELGFGDELIRDHEMVCDSPLTNKSSIVRLVSREDCEMLTVGKVCHFRMATIREMFALYSEFPKTLDNVRIVSTGSYFRSVRGDESSQRLYPIVRVNERGSTFSIGAYNTWPERTFFVIARK